MAEPDYNQISLLVLDVDGVLTDGRIIMTSNGDEAKCFDVKDGAGIKYFQRAGGQVAILTGRESPLVARRAEELGIQIVRQGYKIKMPGFEEILREAGVTAAETAGVGDDLPDLPVLRECAFSAAPSDAVESIRGRVDFVSQFPGGRGCVREVIERILRESGRWEAIMKRYEPNGDSSPGSTESH